MAAEDTIFHNYTDDASTIALLRRLRAGATVDFVHHVDVCSTAPPDLVANLKPAPGTEGTWYFYCPKKFKNAQGKASGHRQRAIGGGDTCWHTEARPKKVADGGGTACNLSYGRKDGRSFNRLGWCMMEYNDNTDATGYVLCKIYRSPRAQVKPSSSGNSASSGSKRKAAEHPEARPAKLSNDQDTFFGNGCAMPACYEPQMIGIGEQQQPSPQFIDEVYASVVAQLGGEDAFLRAMEMSTDLFPQSTEQDNQLVDHQVKQPPMLSGHQITMPLSTQAEEEQVRVQENTNLVAQQSLLQAQGEPDWENFEQDLQFFENNMFNIDDLMDELTRSCCTPAAMTSPDASCLQGLAF